MARPGAGSPVRFLLVGACTALLDYCCYRGALALALSVSPAKVVGFVIGTAAAYLLNRAWTFEARSGPPRVPAFVALYAATLVLNVTVNAAVLAALHAAPLAREVAFVAAQGLTSLANFLGLRHVVFRRH